MTYSFSYTKTRTEVVIEQFEIFLRYAGVSPETREKLVWAVEKRYLSGIGAFLVNERGNRFLEASVEVSWEIHSDLAKLSPTIEGDLPGWEEGAAPEIAVIGRRFGRRAAELGISPRYWVCFTPEVRGRPEQYRDLCRELAVGGDPPRWEQEPAERSYELLDLREMRVSLRQA